MAKEPAQVLRFLSHTAFIVSAALVAFALAPNIYVAVAVIWFIPDRRVARGTA